MKKFIVYGALALICVAFSDTSYAMASKDPPGSLDGKKVRKTSSDHSIKTSGTDSKSIKKNKSDTDLLKSNKGRSEASGFDSLSSDEKALVLEMEKTQIPSIEVPKFFKNPDVLKAFIASLGHNYQGILYNLILDVRAVKKNISSINCFGKENSPALTKALSGLEDLFTAATHQQKNDISKCDKKTADMLASAKSSINTVVSLLELPPLGDSKDGDDATSIKARELDQHNATVSGILSTIVDDAGSVVEVATAAQTTAKTNGGDSVDDETIKSISDSATRLKKNADGLLKAASKRKSARTSAEKETEVINKKKAETKQVTEKSIDAIKSATEELVALLKKIDLVMKLSRGNFENLHQIAEEGKTASRLTFKNLELYRKWLNSSLLNLFKSISNQYGFNGDTGDEGSSGETENDNEALSAETIEEEEG
jgi:hypothetical protein